jgi:hypothetical protein
MSFLPNQNHNEVLAETSHWESRHAERQVKKNAKRAGKQVVAAEVSIPVQSRVAQLAERFGSGDDSDFIASQLRATEDELKLGRVAKGFKNVAGDISKAHELSTQLSDSLGTVRVWGKEGGITREAAAFPVIDMSKLIEQTYSDVEITEADKYSTLAKVGGNAVLLHADGVTQEVIQTIPNIPGAFQVNTMSAAALGEGHVMYPDEIGLVITPEQ